MNPSASSTLEPEMTANAFSSKGVANAVTYQAYKGPSSASGVLAKKKVPHVRVRASNANSPRIVVAAGTTIPWIPHREKATPSKNTGAARKSASSIATTSRVGTPELIEVSPMILGDHTRRVAFISNSLIDRIGPVRIGPGLGSIIRRRQLSCHPRD